MHTIVDEPLHILVIGTHQSLSVMEIFERMTWGNINSSDRLWIVGHTLFERNRLILCGLLEMTLCLFGVGTGCWVGCVADGPVKKVALSLAVEPEGWW